METKNPNRPDDFPILDFKECPTCKSLRRVANELLQIEIEKGKMPKTSAAFLFSHQSMIAAAGKTWLSAPVVVTFYDMCMDCGTVYCIHAEAQTVVHGGKPQTNTKFSTS